MGGFRVILALALVGVGGWLMYATINSLPLVPGFLGSSSSNEEQKPPTSENPGNNNPPTTHGPTTTAPGTGIR